MANARGKAIDNTHLSIDQAEARGFIHRDYIAHCLRWTHVAKYLQRTYRTARVLDVGCGVDLPLARLLYSSKLIVYDYVGVEYNHSRKFKVEPFHSGRFPLSAYGSIDFATERVRLQAPESSLAETQSLVIKYEGDNEVCEHMLPNTIVSFEMIEHIEPGHARAVMSKIYYIMRQTQKVLGENPVAFISTPCWDPNVGAAGNHVNEMKYEALGTMLESLGFIIEDVAGTFASQRDYKDALIRDGHLKTYEALAAHYDSNYLATIFAPLYPEHSRNALWTLRVPTDSQLEAGIPSRFPPLSQIPGPWTSSANWEELASDEQLQAILRGTNADPQPA